MEVLGRRELNRAVLARQWLSARVSCPVVDVLARLVGMQAQAPDPPYVGLWARVEGFGPEDLGRLVRGRVVVRLALMRSTIHLVTADDCVWLRPLLQPVLERGFWGAYRKALGGVDGREVAAAGARVLEAEGPLTFAVLGERLRERWPEVDGHALAAAVRTWVPLVQVPPRGLWGAGGVAAHVPASVWLGGPPAGHGSLDELVLRYLAGFGPASVRDVQVWSGLTRLGEVVARLRPGLRVFRDESGVELFDLPEAPRPSGDAPAPVRLLGEFDNLLLSYADRSRIISDERRKRIFTANGLVPGTVLVDGFVAGVWKLVRGESAVLEVGLFEAVPARERAAVEAEGLRLLEFVAPGEAHEVRVGVR